jgi:hypothetical protein
MKLDIVRPLYDQPGPWASVSLDASHDTEDATSTRALRWRALRESLVKQGAAKPVRDALEQAVSELPNEPGQWGAVLMARAGEPPRIEVLAHPPVAETASWSMLPDVAEIVRSHVNDVSWMRVVVDRTGADLAVSDRDRGPVTETVTGSEQWPLHKSGKGGWSQARYERSVEETWDRNAAEVAEEMVRVFDRLRPELVLLAGDPDAVQLVAKRLPERVAANLVLTGGSRAPGSDERALLDATDIAAVEMVERQRQLAVDRYRSNAQRGLAVDGLADVALALRARAVDTLLLAAPDRSDQLWLWESDSLQIAADPAQLGGDPSPVNAGSALLAGAAVSDASVVIDVTDRAHWRDGVGAVLRFPIAA